MRKLTHKEFLDKLYQKKGNEYTALEDYAGAATKIKFRHNICGRIFETTPDKIYNGGCIKCGYEKMKTKQRKTDNEFKKEVFSLVETDYTFIDKYVNNTTRLKVKHNLCGHIYMVTPRDFLSGRRCPNCKGKRISDSKRVPNSEFMQKLEQHLDTEYIVLNKYINAKEKLKVKHLTCGLIYEVAPYKLLNGNRCPVCVFKEMGKKRRKKHEEFIKKVYEKRGDEYTVLGQYITNRIKIAVRHNKCGTVWEISPDVFLQGNGCPVCKESKGEKKVENILKKYSLSYVSQYKFNDCVYINKLIFDFAVKKDNKIVALIEYQGEQHYKPVSRFGGEKTFAIQKIKDDIKREYAKNNKIPLIEIPYYITDIEEYLINKITPLIKDAGL